MQLAWPINTDPAEWVLRPSAIDLESLAGYAQIIIACGAVIVVENIQP